MAKFIFNRLYKCSNGEIDDENVWVSASNKAEAYSMVREEYPNSIDITLISVE